MVLGVQLSIAYHVANAVKLYSHLFWFIQIFSHPFQIVVRLLLAVGIRHELDDVVDAPFSLLATERELLLDDLYVAVEGETDSRRSFLQVHVFKLDVTGLQVVRIAVLHLRPVVLVEEADFFQFRILFLNSPYRLDPGVAGETPVIVVLIRGSCGIQVVDDTGDDVLSLQFLLVGSHRAESSTKAHQNDGWYRFMHGCNY